MSEPTRPGNLIARYRSAGHSYVDVLDQAATTVQLATWACHGCKNQGPRMDHASAQKEASNHSSRCRAMHLG
ncbi:hypothetical protein ABT034_33530 [Streptomyces sp. NPDC002773]|uniref:hypothetical protein n=1 Tax=Streptomyces sp. NPDC002773 TaxID=3154430 RepID=UPI00331CC766